MERQISARCVEAGGSDELPALRNMRAQAPLPGSAIQSVAALASAHLDPPTPIKLNLASLTQESNISPSYILLTISETCANKPTLCDHEVIVQNFIGGSRRTPVSKG